MEKPLNNKNENSKQESLISDIEEFRKEVNEFCKENRTVVFRGQSDSNWDLVPQVGRNPIEKGELSEHLLFELFKKEVPVVSRASIPPSSDWEWMAYAQHHGLATRFLDWTRNPFVAAYFAVSDAEISKTCGAVYCYNYEGYLDYDHSLKRPLICKNSKKEDLNMLSPLDIKSMGYLILPIYNNPRIVAQSGLFSIQGDPYMKYDKIIGVGKFKKIHITNTFKEEFKYILYRMGFHQGCLFPDADGVSKYLNYRLSETTRNFDKPENFPGF